MIRTYLLRSVSALVHLLALVLAGLILLPPAHAQEPTNRAGLLIQHGDGTVLSTCVAFEESSISGLELLRRAGVSFNADSSTGLGVSICALDDEGCQYPDEHCFCQCQGANCRYWIYWHLGEEGWQYSQIGASDRKLGHGAVDGWIWGTGSPSSGERPPATSFDEICATEPAAMPSNEVGTVTVQALGTTVATDAVATTGAPSTAPTMQASATPSPTPSAGVTEQLCSANYAAFLAIVVVLAGIMARQVRRS